MLSEFWKLEVQSQSITRTCSLWRLWGRIQPGHLQLLMLAIVLGTLCRIETSLPSLLLSLRGILSLCLSLSNSIYYKETSHPVRIQPLRMNLTWVHLSRSYFQIRSYWQMLGRYLKDTVQPSTVIKMFLLWYLGVFSTFYSA